MNNKFSKVKFSHPQMFYPSYFNSFSHNKYNELSKSTITSQYTKYGYVNKAVHRRPLGLQDAGSKVFVLNSSQHTDKLNSLAIGKQNRLFNLQFSYASNNLNTVNQHRRKARSGGCVPPKKKSLH